MARVFFFLFAAVGALSPYLPIHYRNLGLSGTEISLLMSVSPALLFLSQPIFGPMTDRSGHRGRMLGALFLVVAGAVALIPLGSSFWALLPLVALWSFFTGPMVPIADSIALGESQRTSVPYPQIRLWGSVGFLVATSVMGVVYKAVDLRWMFAVYAAMMVTAWFFSRRLPAEGVSTNRKPLGPQLKQLVTNPSLLIFLLLCGIMTMTTAAHGTFFSLRLADIGGSQAIVGYAWALAALTEVPVWMILGKITRRFGTMPLLVVAGLAYALRWWLTAVITDPALMVGLQLMQGITFAILQPTSVILVGELTPPELRTSGQALLALVNGGVATILGVLVSGRLVDKVGTDGLYEVMAYVAFTAGAGFLILILTRLARAKRRESVHG